jgi:cullin 1
MRLCKDLNDAFKETIAQGDEQDRAQYVDFNINVLNTSAWPLHPPNTELAIPPELQKTYQRFQLFYEHKHSGRKLTWLWQNCKNELRTLYTSQKYSQ